MTEANSPFPLREGFNIEIADEIRRGDIVYFEQVSADRVLLRVAPPAGFVVVGMTQDSEGVVRPRSKEGRRLLSQAPLFRVERSEYDGALMFTPAVVEHQPTPADLENLRTGLAKLPICQARHQCLS